MPAVQTLEQHRARYALACVRRHANTADRNARGKYHTLVRRLPAMVLRNGLGQALAFLLADAEGKDKPSRWLYNDIADWLCGSRSEEHPERVYPDGKLLDLLFNGSREDYRRAQDSTLALLGWMRKFADAFIEDTGA